MAFHFNAALKVEEEQFGDAILTALPERLVKAGPLPGHPRFPQLEPRGAIWVEITTSAGVLSVINTHLGLVPREQRIQAAGARRQSVARRPRRLARRWCWSAT